MTRNPSARNRIAPLWRCPYCLFGSVQAGERKEIYLPLPELKQHLLKAHNFNWATDTRANRKRWCPDDDRVLREGRARGRPMQLIADEMGRSLNSIWARWSLIKDKEIA